MPLDQPEPCGPAGTRPIGASLILDVNHTGVIVAPRPRQPSRSPTVRSVTTAPGTGPEPAPGGAPARAASPLLRPEVDAAWAEALRPVEPVLARLRDALRAERAAGVRVLPDPPDVLRALHRPLGEVRVLVVGQDPYPTPGHAVGLAFGTAAHVAPLPKSLQNINRELADDVGVHRRTGDLTGWADQGVLLLNRVLTVRAGEAASHRGLGWEQVTEQVVRTLVARGGPLVAVLWGRQAQELRPLLDGVPVVAGAHPSPLSAHRGFLGSRPFSRVDTLLAEQGAPPVDWSA